MLRSVVSQRVRIAPKVLFQRRSISSSGANDGVEVPLSTYIGSDSVVFHNLFESVHDYTSLPWLAAIPLTTILIRSLITPLRYYYARIRRDQRLAIPKLNLAARVVERQAHARLATAVESKDQNQLWIKKEWAKRRADITREHKHTEPSSAVKPESNADYTRYGAAALVAINTISVIRLSEMEPIILEIGEFDLPKLPLLLSFGMLALYNTKYYVGDNLSRIKKEPAVAHSMTQSLNPFKWTEIEFEIFRAYVLPIAITMYLGMYPTAVALSCLSNSAYTWVERHSIDRMLNMPPRPQDLRLKLAAQTTRHRK